MLKQVNVIMTLPLYFLCLGLETRASFLQVPRILLATDLMPVYMVGPYLFSVSFSASLLALCTLCHVL